MQSVLLNEHGIGNLTLIAEDVASFPPQTTHSNVKIIDSNSGRNELLAAIKKIVQDKSTGILNGEAIDQDLFSRYLSASMAPFPDLVIRTGNNQVVGNALLWQNAYAEFWSTPKRWEELDPKDISEALASYQNRERRFGQVLKTAS